MSDSSLQVFTAGPEEINPEDNVVATYYVEGRGITIHQAAVKIAAEESIGTWTEVTTTKSTSWIVKNLSAKAFEFQTDDGRTGFVKIAYPVELFDYETGGIPNILSIIAGNLLGMASLDNVRLMDADFPKSIVSTFKGPKFGIEEVRRIIGTEKDRRPHIGTIIKPKVGLNPKETAKVAYEAAVGGVDFIKDDETLTNQKFCPLFERIPAVMEALDRVKSETGRNVLYAPDITAETYKIHELADRAIEHGARFLMVDVVPCGYSAIRMLAEDPSVKVPIHVHRAGHGAFTRNPKHGISLMILAKLTRLAGGDQLHTGTAAGKMDAKIPEIKSTNDFLRGEFHGLRSTFPVASGGVHPALVPTNIEQLGRDLVIQAGGGIHGHPQGTRAGAMAMKQAVEACMRGVTLEEYARTHQELAEALRHWSATFLS
jgi:ribulose-bisphosphate carboxylase large chain